jgi:hypothetical protein
MILKSISVTILSAIALLTAPTCADGICESHLKLSELSVPAYQRAIITPSKFQSSWRNHFSFWRNRKNLVEISNIPVRNQCFGTCYLYSTQTVLETALKSQKVLQPGDYLVNFIPMMKIAWNRYQKNPSQEIDLEHIINGGTTEGLEVASQGATFYLSAEIVKAIGGPVVVEEVEHQLVENLMRKGWLFWDRHRRLRKLLSLDQNEFLDHVRKMFVAKLSKAAGRKIELKPLYIASVDVTIYSKRRALGGFGLLVARGFETTRFYRWSGLVQDFDQDNFEEFVEHDFELYEQPDKVGSIEWSRYERAELAKDILPDFLRSLEQNKAVDIVLDDIFMQRNGMRGAHAVSLVGAYSESKAATLKAFKFVNSWSTKAMAKGFGYLTRDLLESYFQSGLVVRAVNLAQPLQAP